MKNRINQMIQHAVLAAHRAGILPSSVIPDIAPEEPRLSIHGDFSTTIPLAMASSQKMAPRKIAEAIVNHMDAPKNLFTKIEIAGPGFINFFIEPSAWYPVLMNIQEADAKYGASNIGNGKKVQVEFVSANPTGPLHVGHGRGAAVGDSVANILSFCGYDVQREYYINDSGRQIQTLGRSVYIRYLQLCGKNADLPKDCYQGDYILEFSREIKEEHGDELLNKDESEAILYCARRAADGILKGIQDDLNVFGVWFDKWYSEQSLFGSGRVDELLKDYQQRNLIYKHDGALWFRTSEYGDEKDRVVVRQNGQTTYFASDIAYHEDKYLRGFDRVIDVWGADHHGYIPRMKSFVKASGREPEQFHVILVKLVNLLRGGEPVAMSTRAGEFVTLREVVDEVGSDSARFIFLTRHYESPLDFDLEVAKKKSDDNPVFYVQYVHARISSILEKAAERGMPDISWNDEAIGRLIEPEEIHLIKAMARYPDVVASSANNLEPHRITYYLMDVATGFHAYYNKHRVLTDDPVLTHGRLFLVRSIRKVIRNGLTLLGVSAPEKM